MVRVPIVCPKCQQTFTVSSTARRGKCPRCTVALVYERVPSKLPEKPLVHQGQHIDITAIEEKIDFTLKDRSVDIHSPQIQDIAVISTLPPPKKYSRIKITVNSLLRARG